jgi:hypothetical protein
MKLRELFAKVSLTSAIVVACAPNTPDLPLHEIDTTERFKTCIPIHIVEPPLLHPHGACIAELTYDEVIDNGFWVYRRPYGAPEAEPAPMLYLRLRVLTSSRSKLEIALLSPDDSCEPEWCTLSTTMVELPKSGVPRREVLLRAFLDTINDAQVLSKTSGWDCVSRADFISPFAARVADECREATP